jgi:hypothetical protein
LGPTRENFYQSWIEILRWCVELGRIDIITEVSMLSTYLCLPHEGHLENIFHVFEYLGLHHNAIVVSDPTYAAVYMGTFIKIDWKSMYDDVKEIIPSDAPLSHGKEIDLRLCVDSDHAGEQFTRHSRTGFVIYLNMAPIVWFSKCQPTVESIVFGAECVAMKNKIETYCGLRYKLIIMGVALSGPIYVYGDNMSVVHNTQRPESFVVLYIVDACCMAKGHNSAVIVLYHFEIAWFSIDPSAAHSAPLDLSTRQFCHCVFMPLKLSR